MRLWPITLLGAALVGCQPPRLPEGLVPDGGTFAPGATPAELGAVTLSPDDLLLAVGETKPLTVTVKDVNGASISYPIRLSVSPPRVASVDGSANVTALAPGLATVYASAHHQVVASAVVRVIGSTVGPVSFVHENPFPTGNDLQGGGVIGVEPFFVGGNGTVLSRGTPWQRHLSAPAVTLRAVAGASPNDWAGVGVSGNTGVLITKKTGASPPDLKTFDTIEPVAIAYDGTHGMAVGRGNDVLLYRSGTWRTEYSPSYETLLTVVGNGKGKFITLGDRGSLYAFDPVTSTWSSLYQKQLLVRLVGAVIDSQDGSSAWAAGGTQLWRYQAGAWKAESLPSTPAISELTAIGVLDGKIVLGAQSVNGALLLRFDPATGGTAAWTSQALRPRQAVRGIFNGSSDAFAVGDFGTVWRVTATGTFSELSKGSYADVADLAVVGADVFVAMNECAGTCSTKVGQVLAKVGGGELSPLGASQPFSAPLSAIAARSATEVYAGGDEGVFKFDGASWTRVPFEGAITAIYDLAVCGEELIAVGAMGMNFRGKGMLVRGAPLGSASLRSVHCHSKDEIWIAGDAGLFQNGVPRDSMSVSVPPLRSVWAGAPNEAFAFGDAGFGVFWDGGDLVALRSPGNVYPDVLAAVWGSAPDNVYAVGHTVVPVPFGYALRFDGAYFRLIDAGAHHRATAVSGSSHSEVWIGTEGGGVLRATH